MRIRDRIAKGFLPLAALLLLALLSAARAGEQMPVLKDRTPAEAKLSQQMQEMLRKAKTPPQVVRKDDSQELVSEDYFVGKTRPWNCPVCGHKVNIPLESIRYEDADADLCPHPRGKIRFMSEIVICPRCGFSAFQADFRAQQTPANIAWVKSNLQPGMQQTLRNLLGPEVKVTPEQLLEIFMDQNNIPDTLRTMNAYAYYLKRFNDKDPGVPAAGLARVAWMAAWAHRREVSSPVRSGPLLEPIRRISAVLQKETQDSTDLEQNIRTLTRLYADKERFDIFELQIIRLYQAGYYSRLGLNFWARAVLEQIHQEANRQYADELNNPWLRARAFVDIPPATKFQFINGARLALAKEAKTRGECLDKELMFLDYAITLIIQGLTQNQYPTEDIPTLVYLVGEFERRRENFSRGLIWLDAARQMQEAEAPMRIEGLAPVQIDLLKRYVQDRGLTPPPAPQANADWQMLQALAQKVQSFRAERKEAPAAPEDVAPAGTPPATGTTPPAGTGAPEVQK